MHCNVRPTDVATVLLGHVLRLRLKLARVFVDLTDCGTVPDRQTGIRKGSVSELGLCPWNIDG